MTNAIYDGDQTGAVELVAMNTRGEHLYTLVQAMVVKQTMFFILLQFLKSLPIRGLLILMGQIDSGVGFLKSYWGSGTTFTDVAFSAPDANDEECCGWYTIAWDGFARYTFGEGAPDYASRGTAMSATVNAPDRDW